MWRDTIISVYFLYLPFLKVRAIKTVITQKSKYGDWSLSKQGFDSVKEIESNLFIADMLHIGHIVTADIFSWNQPNYDRKPLHSGHFYSEQLLWETHFLAKREKFKPNLPLYSEHPIFCGKSKIKLLLDFQFFSLTHFSTFTFSELSNFSKALLN